MAVPHIDAQTLRSLLPMQDVIDAVAGCFTGDMQASERTHVDTGRGLLLLMPAWEDSAYFGVKLVSVMPANRSRGLPTIQGTYTLFSGKDGTPLVTLDGRMLTLIRTAAASAVASRALAAPDAAVLTMIGAGALAPHLVRAHAAVLPIRSVFIWNRSADAADSLQEALRDEFDEVVATRDLPAAVRSADLVSCATSSTEPLVRAEHLAAGSHLDLVGSFTPLMCEAEPACFPDADVYVDVLDGARKEAGDLIQAVESGAWAWSDLRGELRQLLADGPKRQHSRSAFKSVGAAQEDLAAAILAWQRYSS